MEFIGLNYPCHSHTHPRRPDPISPILSREPLVLSRGLQAARGGGDPQAAARGGALPRRRRAEGPSPGARRGGALPGARRSTPRGTRGGGPPQGWARGGGAKEQARRCRCAGAGAGAQGLARAGDRRQPFWQSKSPLFVTDLHAFSRV